MLENGNTTKQKKRLSLKWVLLFSCALLITMVITFSITLAYLGGSSDKMSASLYLKSPLYVGKETSQTNISMDKYMIPGVNVIPTCELTLMSGNGEDFNKDATTDALVRAKVTFTGNMGKYLSEGVTYADVYKTATASGMIDSNKVCRIVKHPSDGYWYFVNDKTATTIADSTLLYEVPLSSNGGELTVMFKLSFAVSTSFTNADGGKTATATIEFKAIQSLFYNGGETALAKTYANAKTVFNKD